MDLQKEREAFESWWVDFHNGRQIACDYVEEDNSYAVGYANAQWVAWQAAKAQAVPEGFVLVAKDIPDAVVEVLENSSYHWGEHTRDYFAPIYSIMIEAQEPK